MLEHKGIPYKRVDLMPVISRGVLKALRFPGVTIPSLQDRRPQDDRLARDLQGARRDPARSRRCSQPTPERRAAVEEAERWGEEVLADAVRRIFWNAIKRDKQPLRSYIGDARLGVPVGFAVATAAPIIAAEMRIHGADDERVRERTSPLFPDGSTGSTPGSPRACSAATSRTRPISRSPAPSGWR